MFDAGQIRYPAEMRTAGVAAVVVGAALTIRVVRSRHRRFLHPDGRCFEGELVHRSGRYRATVRVSKGIGTRGGRADIRGLAIRVHLPGRDRDLDLLLSTAGRGRIARHVPALRRTFDTGYGTITAYRTGTGRKIYLTARPDREGPALGRALDELAEGDRMLLGARLDGAERVVARLTLGRALPPAADGALAYDPVRNSLPELHPTGLIHRSRAFAYRISQRWRRAPAQLDPA
jgi:hypothetical protein